MYQHTSVLLAETLELMRPRSGEHLIDGTLGGGGHAAAILEQTGPDGQLIGGDLDPAAITAAGERLKPFGKRVHLRQTHFQDLPRVCHEQFPDVPISLVLLDLGVSSFELEDQSRGFSFLTEDAPLDMRFGETGLTAKEILNSWPEGRLITLFRDYGEEKFSQQIAKAITRSRQAAPVVTTGQLTELILDVYRRQLRSTKEVPWIGGRHPATLVFQALRIAVNDEIGGLTRALPQLIDLLVSGGRLAVISFHSLEDTIVKQQFREASRDCLCPPEFPVCRCDHHATITLRKPIVTKPSLTEQRQNPRSRSARLRVAEKK